MNGLRSHTPSNHHYRPHPLLRTKTVEDLSDSRHQPRPRTHRAHTYDEKAGAGPWKHMAKTYAWVVEQETVRFGKDCRQVDHWVLEQQVFFSESLVPRRIRKASGPGALQQTVWEEMVYGYEEDAVRWMRHEEEARRMAIQREKEKTRLVQEEVRRIEARIRQRRDQEKQRLAEDRSRAYAEFIEREKREQARADQIMIDAWRAYETRWTAITSSSDPLTFRTIPWPVISPPLSLESITPRNIVVFLFSQLHSKNQSRRERIRSAQLRWHPDRFRRLMGRVIEQDKATVEEGVGIVARCLNDLMARETNLLQNVRSIRFWVIFCH